MNRRRFLLTTGLASGSSLLPPNGGAQTLADCPNTSGLPPVPRTQDHLYRPKPQFWSFDNQDPILSLGPFQVSFQIFTTGPSENSYGLAAGKFLIEEEGRRWTLNAASFAAAGQQMLYPGTLKASLTQEDDGSFQCTIAAAAAEPIRAVKMRLHRIPSAHCFQTGWNVDPNGLPITADGLHFSYPEYQGGLPGWQLAFRGTSLGILSTDLQPRPKRFTAYLQNQETVVELVHEEDARFFKATLEVPAWRFIPQASLADVIAQRTTLLEQHAGLVAWEARTDVPAWTRGVKLVVTLHGMHWSGFIFNDYARMKEIIDWVCRRIPGSEVVFHLAGWEGRYYRCYGDSRPDDRMGGEAGLAALMQSAHEAGAHVLPFYSGNYPSPGLPRYNEYAPSSHSDATDGFRWDPMRGYTVDWGQLRGSGMNAGGPSLNPGAPAWRDFLIDQIASLNARFHFDGAYFDTQPSTGNDSRFSALDGFRTIATQLRQRQPEFLIASESWFDLSLPFVPWSQTPDGPGRWSGKYQRRFAHLSMGEPSRGSTGVHELGHIPYNREELDSMFDLCTLAFVDGTLDHAAPEIETLIKRAHQSKL